MQRRTSLTNGGRNSKDQAAAVENPAPENADSRAITKKSREQLVDELILTACNVTGTRCHEVADRIIEQVAYAHVCPKPKDVDDQLIKAISTISEMAPRNLTEAMLATQMVAANDAALMFLRRATLDNQTFDGVDANVLRATRLMRLFNEQLEAMQRLKGKAGQQKVTVEHVHVYQGGQAIVGTVNHSSTSKQGEPQ